MPECGTSFGLVAVHAKSIGLQAALAVDQWARVRKRPAQFHHRKYRVCGGEYQTIAA